MKRLSRIPLLADHHNHVSFYSSLIHCLNLGDTPDKAEALKKVAALPASAISVALGWNSGYYTFTPGELKAFPPVIIINISLHSFLISPSAEEALRPQYPEIIAHYRKPVWFENHMPEMLIFAAEQTIPTPEKIAAFFNYLERQGVWSAEDMLTPGENFYRILAQTPYINRTDCWATPAVFRKLSPETRQHIRGVKLFTDGALGAYSAALAQPFLNGAEGALLHSDETLYQQMRQTAEWGKMAAIHAIGENATNQAVRMAQQLHNDGVSCPPIRLEHAQFILPKTARLAKDLGIILSMQPNFSTDSIGYADRLTDYYRETNNPFRMLIDEAGFIPGKDLIFGSDGMPHGAQAAISAALFPPYPGQRLTLEEFTAAACHPDFTPGALNLSFSTHAVTVEPTIF